VRLVVRIDGSETSCNWKVDSIAVHRKSPFSEFRYVFYPGTGVAWWTEKHLQRVLEHPTKERITEDGVAIEAPPRSRLVRPRHLLTKAFGFTGSLLHRLKF
jgi:hypothetical protein